MFSNNTPVFFRPLPDESLGTLFDFDSHALSTLKTELLFGLVPGNELAFLIDFVKILFEKTHLMFSYEISYRIPESFPWFFQPGEISPCARCEGHSLIRDFFLPGNRLRHNLIIASKNANNHT